MDEIEMRFRAFHAANPQVYQYVCRFLQEIIDRGRTRYGIGMVWERIRWHVEIELGHGPFKMPNNHRAEYARMWRRDHPAHAHLLRICTLRRNGGGGPRDKYGLHEGDDRA